MTVATLLRAFSSAGESLLQHRIRSALTALGIVFGVASVIAMLAIGQGAQQEVLEQMKTIGVNNILIQQVQLVANSEGNEGKGEKLYSRGLQLDDAAAISTMMPEVERVSPVIIADATAIANQKSVKLTLKGVGTDYNEMMALSLSSGKWFSAEQVARMEPVAIINAGALKNLRVKGGNLSQIKISGIWYQVIGTLSPIGGVNSTGDAPVAFIPSSTMLYRHQNRGRVTQATFAGAGGRRGMFIIQGEEEEEKKQAPKFNQLDELVVQVAEPEMLGPASDILKRMLKRRHNGVEDFTVTVPELLLKQQQRTKQIFNLVLGTIAGISLLVGGIGIMNIMLVSIMERIREIGLRLALGATRRDISIQFLLEAILLSTAGGLAGLLLGFLLSYAIEAVAEVQTIVSPISVVLAVGVSIATGIIFGLHPAKKASKQAPAESLRYE